MTITYLKPLQIDQKRRKMNGKNEANQEDVIEKQLDRGQSIL